MLSEGEFDRERSQPSALIDILIFVSQRFGRPHLRFRIREPFFFHGQAGSGEMSLNLVVDITRFLRQAARLDCRRAREIRAVRCQISIGDGISGSAE